MKATRHYSVLFLAAASLACTAGCFSPDPRTVDGALAYAARAAEEAVPQRLFRILDQRGRHALDATVKLRQQSATVIRELYPPDQQAAALGELGDAATLNSTEQLFVKRCDSNCIDWFRNTVGAAAEQHDQDGLVRVRTVRDTDVTLRLGKDGWYGIVWRTAELSAERDRAARDLAQIQDNARVYSARRLLESQK
jgi:hypothetical protein